MILDLFVYMKIGSYKEKKKALIKLEHSFW
jgi:hypothetical protein